MSGSTLFLIIGLIAGVAGSAAMLWSIRKAVRLHTEGRVPLAPHEFTRLFPGKEVAAHNVRRALQGVVCGDIRLIRPQDRIVADLRVGAIDGLDVNQVAADLERMCGITIPNAEAEAVRTVGELVDMVANAIAEQSRQ